MIQGVAKYVGAKALGAVLVVSSALVVIWYWRLPIESREALWGTARGALIWIGLVAVLPWATFFVPTRVVRAESNLISALALLGYLAVDVAIALYLTGGHTGNAWQQGILILGFLCAAVYNFVVCDFLAEHAEESA